MQLGHILLALLIATFDWKLKTILLIVFFSLLPNFDVFLVWLKIVPSSYHCANSFTHTIVFALIVSGITLIFSAKYALFALITILLHLLLDSPTNTGIRFFYPISKKRYTINLWKETGFWGWKSLKGYYTQKYALITELLITTLLTIRLFQIY